MNPQTQKILQDKANEKYPERAIDIFDTVSGAIDRKHNAEQESRRKAYLAGCNEFIDVCLKFIEWVAENYTDVNMMVDNDAVWEHFNTKEKFTTEQLLDYYLQNIYYMQKHSKNINQMEQKQFETQPLITGKCANCGVEFHIHREQPKQVPLDDAHINEMAGIHAHESETIYSVLHRKTIAYNSFIIGAKYIRDNIPVQKNNQSPELTKAIEFILDYKDRNKLGDGYISVLSLAQCLIDYHAQFTAGNGAVLHIGYGAKLIAEERNKQISKHGYSLEHDKQHNDGELVDAAIAYLRPNSSRETKDNYDYNDLSDEQIKEIEAENILYPSDWPFNPEEWHGEKDDRITQLKKAGAFIAAEIERIDHLNPQQQIPLSEEDIVYMPVSVEKGYRC